MSEAKSRRRDTDGDDRCGQRTRHTRRHAQSICAKSVLPTFTGHLPVYGRQEITQEWRFQFQIGTKLNRPLGLATIGFQQN